MLDQDKSHARFGRQRGEQRLESLKAARGGAYAHNRERERVSPAGIGWKLVSGCRGVRMIGGRLIVRGHEFSCFRVKCRNKNN
jgi:hypothetical protein